MVSWEMGFLVESISALLVRMLNALRIGEEILFIHHKKIETKSLPERPKMT